MSAAGYPDEKYCPVSLALLLAIVYSGSVRYAL